MPKHVKARAAQDEREERTVSKLAQSHHAPSDWKMHAQMVIESGAGKTPDEIAAEFGCHPQTVRVHVARFNEQGIEGLGMHPGSGRKPRLSEQERSRILALVKQAPTGRLERSADDLAALEEHGSAKFRLDALTTAAHAQGIHVERSQIRRIFVREGKRWRRTHSWATSTDKDARPKGTAVVTHYIQPPAGSTTICTGDLGPVCPRPFPPASGWSADGHRINSLLDYYRGPEKVWMYGAAAGPAMAK
jgi:transposase